MAQQLRNISQSSKRSVECNDYMWQVKLNGFHPTWRRERDTARQVRFLCDDTLMGMGPKGVLERHHIFTNASLKCKFSPNKNTKKATE